jgi:hypothetical protein
MKNVDFCAGDSGSPAYQGRLRGYLGVLMEFLECMAFFAYIRVKKSADLELFKGVFEAF